MLLLISEWNPDKISKVDLFRGIQLGLEMALMEPMTQVNGVVFIEDLDDLSFSHIFEISPSYTSMTMEFVSLCFQNYLINRCKH